MHRPIISIQLYTVRENLSQDPMGTLELLRSLGYEGVEGAAIGNSDQFIQKIKALGLLFTGGHADLHTLETRLDEVLRETDKLGHRYIILPWVDQTHRGAREKWAALGQQLDGIGEKLGREGITLCYHHHDFEIAEKYGQQTALDVLLENSSPKNLKAELDTYWIQKGGDDPMKTIEKHAGRVPIVHLKDMDENGDFAEVGEGELDWAQIFNASERQGVKIYAVEQDVCAGDALESAATSIGNLRKMRKL